MSISLNLKYTSSAYAQHREFWSKKMVDKTIKSVLQGDQSIGADREAKDQKTFVIDSTAVNILNKYSKGSTLENLILLISGLFILLSRYESQENVVLHTCPLKDDNFSDPGRDEDIPLFAMVSDDQQLIDFIKSVNEDTTSAFRFQDYPITTLANDAGTRVFSNVLVVNTDIQSVNPAQFSQYDLVFCFFTEKDALCLSLSWRSFLFSEGFIRNLAEHFKNVLTQFVELYKPVGSLDFLSENEKNKLIFQFNDTFMSLPDKTVVELFEERVARNLQHPAIFFNGETFSYGALNEFANTLAAFMKEEHAVKPGQPVAVLMEKSQYTIISLLAILKLGAVYVPVDCKTPIERLKFIVRDANIRLIVTNSGYLYNLDLAEVELIAIDIQLSQMRLTRENLNIKISGSDPAYIIYTSGSTGQPKGVLLAHSGLVNISLDHINRLAIIPSDNYFMFMSVSFDASLLDIFMTLLAGAQLVIPEEKLLQRKEYYTTIIKEQKVTLSTFTPSFIQIFEEHDLSGLRVIICGGEVLTPAIANKYFNKIEFYNAYGPAEATVNATLYKVQGYTNRKWVPIGKTSANKEIFILDSKQRLLPIGVVGELCIAGNGLALKYLNDAELDRGKFIEVWIASEKRRIYRTGDMARWLEDGNLDFICRVDSQIKVNGYRIDIGEIENAINHFSPIDRSVVIQDTQGDTKKISAFCLLRDPGGPTIEVINPILKAMLSSHLASWLPPYMVPNEFYCVRDLPLNINSKQDKLALIALKKEIQDTPKKRPANHIEQKMLQIWRGILGIQDIGTQESFFALGGNSLKAMQIASRVMEIFNVAIQILDVFEHATVEQLSNLVQKNTKTKKGIRGKNLITQLPLQEHYEVSPIQNRLWYLDKTAKQGAYHIGEGFCFRGDFDVQTFRKAYHALLERHEILRTRFSIVDGELRQTIESTDNMTFFSFEKLADKGNGQVLPSQIESTTIDLTIGPLVRCSVFQVGNDSFHVYLNLHHIICDGWSVEVLMKEAALLYNAFKNGNTSPLKPLSFQYKEYAAWLNREVNSTAYIKAREYWMSKFRDTVPRLQIKTDFPRTIDRNRQTQNITLALDTVVYQRLNQMAMANNTSRFVMAIALLKILFFRYTGQSDIVIGFISAGRRDHLTDDLVGPVINTLALRTKIDGNKAFRHALGKVKKSVQFAILHQDFQFDQLVAELNLERTPGRSPVFNILVNYNQKRSDEILFEGFKVEKLDSSAGGDKFEMTITFEETNDNLAVNVSYDTSLFRRERMEALLSHFTNLIASVTETPDEKISQINYLPEEEIGRLLYQFNNTSTNYPRNTNLSLLFSQQVKMTPDRNALWFMGAALSYQKLNRQASCIAMQLIEKHGIWPGDLVALYLDRSPLMIMAIIGIIKTGAVYVPLDFNNPVKRSEAIITDCGINSIITDRKSSVLFQKMERAILLIEDMISCEQMPVSEQFPGDLTTPESLAYVMSTSGSTGKPKNVMIEHRNIIRLVKNTNYYHFGDNERMLQTVPYSFDVSTFEIWGMLLNGGELHIAPSEELLDTDFLKNYLHNWNINIVWFTAGWFNQLAETDIGIFGNLKTLLLGGDKLSYTHVNKVISANPTVKIINCYGPTENTTFSTTFMIERLYHSEIPIGKPIANSTLYVLDSEKKLVPIGIPGEIYVGGDGISKGYIGNKKVTRARFLNLYLEGQQVHVYKTGDLGYWNFDGEVEFLGRDDFQVKIGGYRIELNEIEAALVKHPEIEMAFVMPYLHLNQDKRLAAYYRSSREIPRKDLYSFVRSLLPEYMVPTYFVHLDDVHINANGKIDRARLPKPVADGVTSATERTGITDKEKLVRDAFVKVLGEMHLDINDSFFAVGGNSFLALQLVTELSRNFNISINDVFQHLTISALAENLPYERRRLETRLKRLLRKLARGKTTTDEATLRPRPKAHTERLALSRPDKYFHVLLLGSTGFLGSHFLKVLLDNFVSNIYLVVRAESAEAAWSKLREKLDFYFPSSVGDITGRVHVMVGDLTREHFGLPKADYDFLISKIDCVINCAANTKHYGMYEDFESINLNAVKKVVSFIEDAGGAHLHHVSTMSVASGSVSNISEVFFTEDQLDIGQDTRNYYVKTKFLAEKYLTDKREKGLTCSIYRVGNLVFDSASGIFQKNIQDNAFYSLIKSLIELGYFPDAEIDNDFSFVDQTALAIFTILSSDEINRNYHVYNPQKVTLREFGEHIRRMGYKVDVVSPEVIVSKVLERIDNMDKNITNLIQRFSYLMEIKQEARISLSAERTLDLLDKQNFFWRSLTDNNVAKMMAHCNAVKYILPQIGIEAILGVADQ
jgi:amino acid adenylation domain-containing protein/thioester reductase-like protein